MDFFININCINHIYFVKYNYQESKGVIMKKILIFTLAIFSLFVLNACGSQIPDDALTATCPQGDTFKYVFKDDKVYEFYLNDELQSNDMLAIVQDAVDNAGDTVAYLNATFEAGVCTYSGGSLDDKG